MYTPMDLVTLHEIDVECDTMPSAATFLSVRHQGVCEGGDYCCYGGSMSVNSCFPSQNNHGSAFCLGCDEGGTAYTHIGGTTTCSEALPFHVEMDSAHGLTSTTISVEEGTTSPPAVEYSILHSHSLRRYHPGNRSLPHVGLSHNYSSRTLAPPVLGSTLPITAALLVEEADETAIMLEGDDLSEDSGMSWGIMGMAFPDGNSHQLEVSSSRSCVCARDGGQLSGKFLSLSSSTLVPTVLGATHCQRASPTTLTHAHQSLIIECDATDCTEQGHGKQTPQVVGRSDSFFFEMGGDVCCPSTCLYTPDDVPRDANKAVGRDLKGLMYNQRCHLMECKHAHSHSYDAGPSCPAHPDSDGFSHGGTWRSRAMRSERTLAKGKTYLDHWDHCVAQPISDYLNNRRGLSTPAGKDIASSANSRRACEEVENSNHLHSLDHKGYYCGGDHGSSLSGTSSASAAAPIDGMCTAGKHSSPLPLKQLIALLPLSEEEIEEMARRDKERASQRGQSAILSQTNLKAHQQRFRHPPIKSGLGNSPIKSGSVSQSSKVKQDPSSLKDVLHECKFLGMEDVLASVSNLSAAEFRGGCSALKVTEPDELSVFTAEYSIRAATECSPRTSGVASPGSSCYFSPYHATPIPSLITPGQALVLAAAMTERSLHRGAQVECVGPGSSPELFTAWQESSPLGADCSFLENSGCPMPLAREGRAACSVLSEEQMSFRGQLNTRDPINQSRAHLPLLTSPSVEVGLTFPSARYFDPLEQKVCTISSATAASTLGPYGEIHSPTTSSASCSQAQVGNMARMSSEHFPLFGISTDSKQSSISVAPKRTPSQEIVFTLQRTNAPPLRCKHFRDELTLVNDLIKSAAKAAAVETIAMTKTEVAT